MSSFIVLTTVVLLIIALYSNNAKPSVLFMAAVFVFLVFRILNPEDILKGLATNRLLLSFCCFYFLQDLKNSSATGFSITCLNQICCQNSFYCASSYSVSMCRPSVASCLPAQKLINPSYNALTYVSVTF